MNVLSACADPDTDTWTKWLEQALGLNPDLNSLSDSGGDRFATIDIKMAMGMQNMLRQAPDEAKDVYLDATRHSELRHQQGVIVKGRELVALVMQSFRTSDRTPAARPRPWPRRGCGSHPRELRAGACAAGPGVGVLAGLHEVVQAEVARDERCCLAVRLVQGQRLIPL